jgi:hypothetical protein
VDIIKLDCFGAKPIGFLFGNCWKITAVLILFILFIFSITLLQKFKQFIYIYIYNFFLFGIFFFQENDQVFEDVDLSEQWIHNFNGHAAVVKKLTTIFAENHAAS